MISSQTFSIISKRIHIRSAKVRIGKAGAITLTVNIIYIFSLSTSDWLLLWSAP